MSTTKEWLAVASVHGREEFDLYATQEEAKEMLDAGEEHGQCYSAAIYHIPTKTMHMRDPLGNYDPEKVRASIEHWLAFTPKDL